ncbi:MAG: DUF1674 domain-containing protein [Alphaproteobacteria bacterium]
MKQPEDKTRGDAAPAPPQDKSKPKKQAGRKRPVEIGGPEGPDPVRYGDWEKNGRAIDF